VIHVTSTGPAGLAGLALAARMGVPLVGSVHGRPDPDGPRLFGANGWSRARYDRWFYSRCRALLVPSAAWNQRSDLAPDDDRCIVWRRGVDVNRFHVSRRSMWRRDEWHVSDKRPAILIMGPLCAGRGLALIESLGSFLYRHRLAHRFILAGDGPARAELSQRCPDALFLGRVPSEDLAEVYASADVLIRPGDTLGGCTSVLEAQASGIAVMAADGGNAHEHLRHGRTGYVCRAGDVADFGARLAAVLRDPERLREMQQAARAYALERTWTASLGPVYALYRGLTAPRAGTTPSFALPSLMRRAGR
jgi:phosphatidylinositol alpha 1,6-mannosyltransferase